MRRRVIHPVRLALQDRPDLVVNLSPLLAVTRMAEPPRPEAHSAYRGGGVTQRSRPLEGPASSDEMRGGVLLSREASLAVPSALRGLTSGFGMGPGVSPSLWPPQLYGNISHDGSRPYSGNRIVDASPPGRPGDTCNVCKCVSSPRSVSTGQLSASRRLHFRPINPVVWLGTLPTRGGGRPYLEAGFPLRCFQRLSLPDVANQPCSWRNNWHTRGQSVPVLSY